MSDLLDSLGESTGKALDGITSVVDTYISLEKIIPGVTELFTDQASEIRKLSKELGNGNKYLSEFRSEIIEVSKATGIASKETLKLLDVTRQYHQGVKDSTAATVRFSKITGASADILGKFTAKLNILNGVSSKTMESMYTGILSVRDAYGLTDDQINDVISTLTDYAVVTQASNKEVEQSAIVLSKFTSQLTSAGIEASRVSEIVGSLIDPDRLTDNLMLMSKMGITINDMVSGDPVSMLEGSIDDLKSLGEEIAHIAETNRYQANQIAKIYGLTLQEAIDLSKVEDTEKALDKQKTLQEYQNQAATLADSISYFATTVGGFVAGGLNTIIKPIEELTEQLNEFGKGAVAVLTFVLGKFLLNKIKKGLDKLFSEAARKFGKGVSSAMSDYLPAVAQRSGQKAADAAGLTPRATADEKVGKLGYGYGIRGRAESRREAIEKGLAISGRGKGSISADEYISAFTSNDEFQKKIQEQYKNSNVIEQRMLARRYKYFIGQGDNPSGYDLDKQALNDQLKNIKISGLGDRNLNSLLNSINDTNDLNNYKKLKGATKENKAKSIIESFFGKDVGFNIDASSLTGDKKKEYADIIASSKTTFEALEKLKAVISDKDWKEGSDKVTSALNEINNAVKNNAQLNNDAKEAAKKASVTQEGRMSFGDRLQSLKEIPKNLFGGLKMNIGSFLMKAGKKLLWTGPLALVGMAIPKIVEKLKGNEKFQESMKKISEQVSGLFTSIADIIMPLVEPATEVISGLINIVAPAITKVVGWITSAAGWILKIIGKPIQAISNSVKTIEDSYKEEDLRTMTLVQGASYDESTDRIIAEIAKITDSVKKVGDNTEQLATTSAINSSRG